MFSLRPTRPMSITFTANAERFRRASGGHGQRCAQMRPPRAHIQADVLLHLIDMFITFSHTGHMCTSSRRVCAPHWTGSGCNGGGGCARWQLNQLAAAIFIYRFWARSVWHAVEMEMGAAGKDVTLKICKYILQNANIPSPSHVVVCVCVCDKVIAFVDSGLLLARTFFRITTSCASSSAAAATAAHSSQRIVTGTRFMYAMCNK